MNILLKQTIRRIILTGQGDEKQIQVLYGDDEPDLPIIGKTFLEKLGNFFITTLKRPLAAVDLLKTRTFDLIISDYQMPGMDGIAFLKYLKSAEINIPLILFTGRTITKR